MSGLVTSSGCATVGEALLRGLVDRVYEAQFDDGREEGGLNRAEKRARFEEQSIRFMLQEQAYQEEGRVPAVQFPSSMPRVD